MAPEVEVRANLLDGVWGVGRPWSVSQAAGTYRTGKQQAARGSAAHKGCNESKQQAWLVKKQQLRQAT